jgi:hypothetical protein
MKDSQSREIPIDTFSPPVTALRWVAYHGLFELLQLVARRRLRIRYEDLVTAPRGELQRIIDYAFDGDLPSDAWRFLGEGSVHLGVSHTTAGNGMRLVAGAMPLRVDEQWRQALPRRHRVSVTVLTWPLLRLYGSRRAVRGSGRRPRVIVLSGDNPGRAQLLKGVVPGSGKTRARTVSGLAPIRRNDTRPVDGNQGVPGSRSHPSA